MREEEERKVKKGSQLFQMAADANFGLRTTFFFNSHYILPTLIKLHHHRDYQYHIQVSISDYNATLPSTGDMG